MGHLLGDMFHHLIHLHTAQLHCNCWFQGAGERHHHAPIHQRLYQVLASLICLGYTCTQAMYANQDDTNRFVRCPESPCHCYLVVEVGGVVEISCRRFFPSPAQSTPLVHHVHQHPQRNEPQAIST